MTRKNSRPIKQASRRIHAHMQKEVTFERFTETILRGLKFETCLFYLDTIVFGNTIEEMIDNLSEVFDCLETIGF